MVRRSIQKKLEGTSTVESSGIKITNLFGQAEAQICNPFLMLTDFRTHSASSSHKFPKLPSRGFETITYITRGSLEHEDSLGNKETLLDGQVQWSNAGSGIIQQDKIKEDEHGVFEAFQLRVNLPAAKKMSHPEHKSFTPKELPVVETDSGAQIKILAGKIKNKTGPIRDSSTSLEYFECSLPSGIEFIHQVKAEQTVILYMIEGSILIGSDYIYGLGAVLFSAGDEICIDTPSGPAKFLLFTAQPINEQIAWKNSIVMNTQKELDQAFKEYSDGNFIKHKENARR